MLSHEEEVQGEGRGERREHTLVIYTVQERERERTM